MRRPRVHGAPALTLPWTCCVIVAHGTVVETMAGGGGGNGNPKARPFEEVRVDAQWGHVSREGAWKDCGVRIGLGISVDEGGSEPRA